MPFFLAVRFVLRRMGRPLLQPTQPAHRIFGANGAAMLTEIDAQKSGVFNIAIFHKELKLLRGRKRAVGKNGQNQIVASAIVAKSTIASYVTHIPQPATNGN